eukprot:scaffold113491_cov31-Cyclotella_meneghiniana.AAC.2
MGLLSVRSLGAVYCRCEASVNDGGGCLEVGKGFENNWIMSMWSSVPPTNYKRCRIILGERWL